MPNSNKVKKCRRCGALKSKDCFVDISGVPNPRGANCADCHLIRNKELEYALKEAKEAKLRKLKILYGEWWRHYCLPQQFDEDIYSERNFCPYCGNKLPPNHLGGPIRDCAQLDHMDPLHLGGEDSIRNVVYVCDKCNYKKSKLPFLEWLKILTPKQRAISRGIYVQKHGHPPEDFVLGLPRERSSGIYFELCLDEEELRAMHPKPIVDGPPGHVSTRLTISIDDNGNFIVNSKIES